MDDPKEFDTIFRTYYEALFFFARQYLDEEESDDVVCASLEDLWEHFADIHREAAKSYLYRVVRNKCIDTLRHKKHVQTYIGFVKAMTAEYDDIESHLETEERDRRVAEALAMLQPPTIDIFTACYVEGKSYKEVAEAMGISTNTVKKHISKALALFRERRLKKE